MPGDLAALMKQFLVADDTPFLTCEVTGGLGNQLFQVAAGLAVAFECGFEFRPIRSSSAYTYGGKRPVYWNTVFRSLSTCDATVLLSADTWKEPSFKYHPIPRFSKTTRLVGYFQSYRYFESARSKILSKFTFPADSVLQAFLNQARRTPSKPDSRSPHSLLCAPTAPTTTSTSTSSTNSETTVLSTTPLEEVPLVVSLHVRSYVEPDGSQAPASIHCRLGIDYYRKAIELILARVPSRVVFLVFADDASYARTLLRPLDSAVSLLFLEELDDYKSLGDCGELKLMSMCDHNILANSTFSWWAAYLTTDQRTILAPKSWFGSDGPEILDLVPPSWTLL